MFAWCNKKIPGKDKREEYLKRKKYLQSQKKRTLQRFLLQVKIKKN